MVHYIYNILVLVSASLALVNFFLLIKGPFRKFPVLLAYIIADLATNLVEAIIGNFYPGGVNSRVYFRQYWTDELILNSLLFLLVITLTYRAVEGTPFRAKVGRLLAGITLAVTIIPFVFMHDLFTARWFNSTDQLLNFGGAIMNLALWTALIANRHRDVQVMLVSTGVGLAVTGAAIAFGIRHFVMAAGGPMWVPNIFLNLTHLGGLLVWTWALRPAAKKVDLSRAADESLTRGA